MTTTNPTPPAAEAGARTPPAAEAGARTPLAAEAGARTPPAAEAGAPPPAPRASRRFVALLALAVLALASAGYLLKGTPDYAAQLARAEAQAQAAAAPASMPSAEQIEAMVARLVTHLEGKPEDAEGWTMLGRARALQGRLDDAVAATARAVALRPGDARLLVDHAELLGLKNGRTLAGEPAALLDRALKLDPSQPKGLALAGAAAFDAKDYPLAVQHWERLVAVSDPHAGYLPQVQESLAEARRLGGLPVAGPARSAVGSAAAVAGAAASASAPATTSAQAPTATPTAPGAAAASLSGMVSLAPALAARARPDDTLFVFARAATGPRMPLVILRRQVRELPLAFTLDDTMAMSPAATLAGAGEVIVVARISRSGQAMPQPGDLFGETPPVKVGSRGLQLVIDKATP